MNKNIIIGAVIVIVVVAVAAAFWSGGQKAEAGKVKIGVLTSWILEGPFYVAEEKGFFAEEGIDAEIVPFGDVDNFVPALMAKEILVGESIADMFTVQASRQSNIRQILRKARIFGVDGIIADKSIATLADLKGKQVAVQTVSPSHYFLLNMLERAGLSHEDVTVLPTEASQAGATFIAKKIDVAVTWEPWLTRAVKERADSHLLASTANDPELIYDILMTRGDLTAQEREQVKAVLRAWFKALSWMEQNPDETVKIFSKSLSLSEEEVKFFLEKVDFLTREENVAFYGKSGALGPAKSYLENATRVWQNAEVLDNAPDANKVIDPSFLQEIAG